MLRNRLSKDFKNREGFKLNELDKKCYNYFILSNLVKKEDRYIFQYKFLFKRQYFLTKLVNRCVWTGKTRWVLRKFKLSRMSIKNAMYKGLLVGYKKFN